MYFWPRGKGQARLLSIYPDKPLSQLPFLAKSKLTLLTNFR